MKELQNKIKQNHLILTKADKGNIIVVMDKDDHTKKVESYIMENGYQPMDKDPTEKYQTKIKDVLKENGVSVSEKTTAMNPIAPKLKGLVKLHKEARPMRPLVNYIQSPCYKIAKIAAEFLKENFQFNTRYNIWN